MSILGRRIPFVAIGVMAALMILAALAPALSKTPTREITLVARNMAFYLESDPKTPNPTIEVKARERVRIVLKNQDRGLVHDLAVPAVKKRLDLLEWNESDDLTFTAPKTLGTYQYECQPHRLMMRGTIRVY
jgi:plastocyanin